MNLVKAILRGIRNELKIGFGIHALEVGATIEEPETMEQITEEEFEIFTDNISGANLPAEKVRAGRREEMGNMKQLEVFERVPITECWEKTQRPPIPTGWVDVNKGDEQRPDVRCRLVVKETKRLTTLGPEDAASVFAGTPPLEGLRLLISLAMSGGQSGPDGNVLMFLDISRAHLHSETLRAIYVAAPPEDDECGPDMCWRLLKAMYGLKDAGAAFDRKVEIIMVDEFDARQGNFSPCLYRILKDSARW